MNWVKKIFSKSSLSQHQPSANSGKPFDEIYDDLGAFQYHENGFTLSNNNFKIEIDWDEITQLNVYKSDLITIDRIDMEIVYGDKYITISEEIPGWHQFVLKTKEIFPSIPKDWDLSIIHPAFEANYRTIYDKNN